MAEEVLDTGEPAAPPSTFTPTPQPPSGSTLGISTSQDQRMMPTSTGGKFAYIQSVIDGDFSVVQGGDDPIIWEKKSGAQVKLSKLWEQVVASSQRASASPVENKGDFFWPVSDKYQTITTKHGGHQARAAGYTGPLPETHTGTDISAPFGSAVFAPEGGRIVNTGYSPDYGNYIIMQGQSKRYYRFAHLSRYNFDPNEQQDQGNRIVKAGESIAAVGMSGNTTGAHLHFEVWTDINQGKSGTSREYEDPEKLYTLNKSNATGTSSPGGNRPMADPATPDAEKRSPEQIAWDENVATLKERAARSQAKVVTNARIAEEKDSSDDYTEAARAAQKNSKSLIDDAEKDQSAYTAALAKQRPTTANRSVSSQFLNYDKNDKFIATLDENGKLVWTENRGYDPPVKEAPRPQSFQGTDGRQYNLSADGLTATLIGGQGAPEIKTITDPQTGNIYTKGPDGRPDKLLFKGKTESVTQGGRQIPIDPATGLADPTKAVDLMTTGERSLTDLKAEAEGMASKYTKEKGTLVQSLQEAVNNHSMSPQVAYKKLDQFEEMWSAQARQFKQTETRARADAMSKSTGTIYDPYGNQSLDAEGNAQFTADELGKRQKQGLDVEKAKQEISKQADALAVDMYGGRAMQSTGMPGQMSVPEYGVAGDPQDNIGVRILKQRGLWTDSLSQYAPNMTPQKGSSVSSSYGNDLEAGLNQGPMPQFGPAQPAPQQAQDLGIELGNAGPPGSPEWGMAQNWIIDPNTGARTRKVGEQYKIPAFGG